MKKTSLLLIAAGLIAAALAVDVSLSQAPMDTILASSGLTDQDIGSVSASGNLIATNSGYILSAVGGTSSGTMDALHFAHQSWTGDFVMTARVTDLGGSNSPTKAGITVRSGTGASAPHVFLGFTSKGIAFERRLASGNVTERDLFSSGNATSSASTGPVSVWSSVNESESEIPLPCWLMLVRKYDDFSCYFSTDGTNWSWLSSERIPISSQVEAGIAVGGQEPGQISTARLDQLSLAGLPTIETPSVATGAGDGLKATYLDQATTNTLERVDATVNFQWGPKRPSAARVFKQFTAVWEGNLEAQYTEPYALLLTHNGGVRLWLDGQLLMDNRSDSVARQSRVVVSMQAGRKYGLKVEYTSELEKSLISLRWSSPSTAKQVIPASQLYSREPSAGNNISTRTGGPVDLRGGLSLLTAADQMPNLAAPWLSRVLVGSQSIGNVVAQNGAFLVSGTGGSPDRAPDEGRLTYQPWQGDVEINARMFGVDDQSQPPRMGIMIRENLGEDARTVFLGANRDGRRFFFYRTAPNQGQVSRFAGTAPPWL